MCFQLGKESLWGVMWIPKLIVVIVIVIIIVILLLLLINAFPYTCAHVPQCWGFYTLSHLIYSMEKISIADAIGAPTISLTPPLRSPVGAVDISHAHWQLSTSSPHVSQFSAWRIFLLLCGNLLCPQARQLRRIGVWIPSGAVFN